MVDFNTEPRYRSVRDGSARRVPAGAGGRLFLAGCAGCGGTGEHEVVVARFRHAEPQDLLATEPAPALVDALEMRALLGEFRVELVRRFQARFQYRPRESAQLRAAGDQPAQRLGIPGIVAREHVNVGLRAGRLERGLVGSRQPGPFLEIDDGGELRTALPPARVVVELRDLVQAELLVVVRPDPFGGVYRAALERRVDIAARDLPTA